MLCSDEFDTMPPAEKVNLKVVVEELAAFQAKSPPPELALVLLTSILLTADHLSRTQQPGKATHYAIALNGMERLLSQTTLKPKTPWGQLPASPNSEPAPGWFGRWWERLAGN